ncbi:MAG: hypothetical protein IJ200_11800 [Prevotella sp.]|nr:hypothetical protein [Prevotella sp.]
MKKIYMTPALDIIKIQTQQMIAGSGPSAGGETDNENDLLGRESGFDDEE